MSQGLLYEMNIEYETNFKLSLINTIMNFLPIHWKLINQLEKETFN